MCTLISRMSSYKRRLTGRYEIAFPRIGPHFLSVGKSEDGCSKEDGAFSHALDLAYYATFNGFMAGTHMIA